MEFIELKSMAKKRCSIIFMTNKSALKKVSRVVEKFMALVGYVTTKTAVCTGKKCPFITAKITVPLFILRKKFII